MNEKLKAFADFLGQNEEIKKALNEKTSQVKDDPQKVAEMVLACAKEQGFELSADDLQQKSGKLDDSDLDAVTGGMVCVIFGASSDGECGLCCISGVGSDDGGNNPSCFCIIGGGG